MSYSSNTITAKTLGKVRDDKGSESLQHLQRQLNEKFLRQMRDNRQTQH